MDIDNLTSENTVLNIVKDKFRHDEKVISVRIFLFLFVFFVIFENSFIFFCLQIFSLFHRKML